MVEKIKAYVWDVAAHLRKRREAACLSVVLEKRGKQMKSILALTLCAYLFGCISTSNLSTIGWEDLLNSGKYHEAFLLWPKIEEDEKGTHGEEGRLTSMVLSGTANSGQKDWVAIFKDPNISMDIKHWLLMEIQEAALRGRDYSDWDWDEIERIHSQAARLNILKNEDLIVENENQEGRRLHARLLAYIELVNHPTNDERTALLRMGILAGMVNEVRTSKGESELPNILMDSSVPQSIKAYFIWGLQK